MSENIEGQDDYAFATMSRELENDTDGAPGSSEGNSDSQRSFEDSQEEVRRLTEELAATKSRLDEVAPKLETVDRLQQAFNPIDDDTVRARQREEDIRQYDVDPVNSVNNAIDERMSSYGQRLDAMETKRVATDAMAKIDKEYSIDWGKHAGKIKEELGHMTPEFKKQNPSVAILRAARLAGVAKKKEKLPEFLSPGYTPEAQAKYEKSYSDKYNDSVMRGKQNSSPDVLDKLFN